MQPIVSSISSYLLTRSTTHCQHTTDEQGPPAQTFRSLMAYVDVIIFILLILQSSGCSEHLVTRLGNSENSGIWTVGGGCSRRLAVQVGQ